MLPTAEEIRRIAAKHGMLPQAEPARKNCRTAPHIDEIIRRTKAGETQRSIAQRIGVGQRSINAALHKHGLFVYLTRAEHALLQEAGIIDPKAKSKI